MRRLFLIPLLSLVGLAPMAYAQSTEPSLNVNRAKQALAQTRRQFVESGMELSDTQKDAFWTIFNAYEADLASVAQETNLRAQEYRTEFTTLTNAKAAQMMKESSANNKKAIDLRYKYADQMSKKFGPKVGARFYQLDDYYTTARRLNALDNASFVGDPK